VLKEEKHCSGVAGLGTVFPRIVATKMSYFGKSSSLAKL